MVNPLWSKGSDTDQGSQSELKHHIDSFMSGNDVILDRHLITYDIKASKAHAKGLNSIDVLTDKELANIMECLDKLHLDFTHGNFILDERFEDSHSAIEWYLTQQLGEVGKKIHAGRSRNDQVLVASRLYAKDALSVLSQCCQSIATVCIQQAKQYEKMPLPGYTHIQRAVVSSWGLWFASFAEAFIDNAFLAKKTAEWIDCNPLGTAAGYGVNLNLNRELTTQELDFDRLQVNPMYAQNSRGKFELQILSCFKQAMLDVRRMSWDLSLFSTAEFNFVRMPDLYSTGSSIMPNKRNPDTVELMRAEYSKLVGYYNEIESLLSLPSGYQRDLQNTKAPLINGISTSINCLNLVPNLLSTLEIKEQQCREAVEPAMYATDKVLESVVNDGLAFRDAYIQLKDNYSELTTRTPEASIEARVSPGACGNLLLDVLQSRLENLN